MDPSPLYHTSPPDAPHPPRSWGRTAIGSLLVLLGVEILLERLFGLELSLLWPALGLVLLAAWFRHDRFPFLVAGSLALGFGLGSLVESVLGRPFGFAPEAGMAWGFWFIQQLSGRRIGWARIGFLIMLTGALFDLALTVGVGDALGTVFGGAAAPLALMTVGVLLVFRRRLSPQVFVVGVVVAVSLGLSALGGGLAEGLNAMSDGFGPRRMIAVATPELDGRTLAIESRSGDVTVETGNSLSVKASVRGHHDEITVTEDGDTNEVVVRSRNARWTPLWSSVQYTVVVPPGTDLRIGLRSGDVDGTIAGGDIDIETRSGDVDLVVGPGVEIDVNTRSGDIEAEGFTEDDVDDEDGGRWSYEPDGDGDSGGSVSITTRSGDVDLEQDGDAR